MVLRTACDLKPVVKHHAPGTARGSYDLITCRVSDPFGERAVHRSTLDCRVTSKSQDSQRQTPPHYSTPEQRQIALTETLPASLSRLLGQGGV